MLHHHRYADAADAHCSDDDVRQNCEARRDDRYWTTTAAPTENNLPRADI